MSKKSRRRNKRLLALAGLAGAAALASRRNKLANAKETNNPVGGVDQIAADSKKDKTVNTPTTIQDNKPAKRSNASIAGDFINKINDKKSAESGMQFYDPAVKMPGRKRVSLEQGMSNIDTTPIKQYKSGGRVKGCGKALRGFGRAMKKGKR